MKTSKSIWLLLFGTAIIMAPESLNAAAEKTSNGPNYLSNLLGETFFLLGMAVVFLALITIFKLFMVLLEIQKLRIFKEQGIEIVEKVFVKEEKSSFEKLYEWAVGLKPLEKESDILLDHNYDGIRELDNSLPPWWLAMFYISIVVAVGYVAYFHYFDFGPLQAEEYAIEMKWAEERKQSILAMKADLVNENNVIAFVDDTHIAEGKTIFIRSCAACHGQLGEGGVGPNLTDNYWLHGGDIKSIFKTVKYGVPQKGMIAWKTQLTPSAMQEVSSYILTLVGNTPPNPKAPQGVLFDPSEGFSETDSLSAAQELSLEE